MGETPVFVRPPTIPAPGNGVSSIDLRFRHGYDDAADAYTDSFMKAMHWQQQGAPYRTRSNSIFNHTRETAGIKDRGQRHAREMAMLRSASRTWAWQMFENTRVSQCVRWFSKPAFRGDAGVTVGLAKRGASPSRAQRKRIEEIEKVLHKGGDERERPGDMVRGSWDYTWTRRGEGLAVLLVKALRDLLALGHCAIEIESSRNARVAWMGAVDASRVRMVHQKERGVDPSRQEAPYVPFLRPDLSRPSYVMLDDNNNVAREYGGNELLFTTMLPVTDESMQGYGLSLLELVMELLVAEVMGIRFNREAFVNNRIPVGALMLRNISTEQREAFEQIVKDNVGGGPGKWFRMPILLGEDPAADAQWVSFNNGLERQDMMWQNYIQWVIGGICAVCMIAMEEMGLTSPMSASGSLNNPDPHSRIASSQDKGLVPLLELCCAICNEILSLIEPSGEFEVQFESMRPRDAAQEADLRQRRLDTITTVDEERAWEDLPKRRIPVDVDLWNACKRICVTGWSKQFDDQEIDEVSHEIYYKGGGEYSMSGMIPTNPAQANVVMQEMGSGLTPEDERDQGAMPGQMPPGAFGDQQQAPGGMGPQDDEWELDDAGEATDGQSEPSPELQGEQAAPAPEPIPIRKAFQMIGRSGRRDGQRFRIFEVRAA